MNWNIGWLFWGAAAYVLALVNLGRACLGKGGGWQVLEFASLSCGVLALVEEYRMVNTWLACGDMAALYDVVPGMTGVLSWAAYLGLGLNLAALALNLKRSGRAEKEQLPEEQAGQAEKRGPETGRTL